jgi:DNA-binding GntR family transcriptional regulator
VKDDQNSLAGEAYVVLRERLLRGELPIGKVISRRTIAKELGMSMLPVLEAFLRLELEGLLESRPRAGTRVKTPTEQDVRGQYIMRQALDAESARLCAEVATKSERRELQKLGTRVDMLSAGTETNRFLYLSVHEKLHRRIAECTRCQSLLEAIEKNHVLASTWLCKARPATTAPRRRVHRTLVDVIVKEAPSAAAEAMRAHIKSALENTLQRLEPYFKLHVSRGETYQRVMSGGEGLPALTRSAANQCSSRFPGAIATHPSPATASPFLAEIAVGYRRLEAQAAGESRYGRQGTTICRIYFRFHICDISYGQFGIFEPPGK